MVALSLNALLLVLVYAFVYSHLCVRVVGGHAHVLRGPATEASTIRPGAVSIWILVNQYVVAIVVSLRISHVRRVPVVSL